MTFSIVLAALWQVAPVNGAPGLLRDGKPVSPILFWQRELEEEDVTTMRAAGVDQFSMFIAGAHDDNPYWKEDGSFDMGWQDKYISRFLKWTPDAVCLPRIFYTPPRWWCRAHPEECARFAEKYAADAIGPRASFASAAVQGGEGVTWFRKAIRHLEDAYGERTMGYHLATGPWGEHFNWDAWVQCPGPGHTPPPGGDLSEPMRRAFAAYVREKYGTVEKLRAAWKDGSVTFESVAVPTMAERRKVDAGGWRDPAKGRKVPDYFECHNRLVPDMIAAHAKAVKDETAGRKITLAFYGYTQDEPWAIECDHRAPSRAYAIRELDAFSAPHTYHRRGLGGDALPRQYLASAALHGKLFFDEGDDFTHLEWLKPKHDGRAYATNLVQSLTFLYREFGNAVTYGTGLWYMDLMRDGFRDPELVKAVGRMRAWGEKSLAYPRAHLSEVAVISNPESEFYMDYRNRNPNGPNPDLRPPSPAYRLYHDQIGSFCRAGAPWDWYLAEDLAAVAERPEVKVVALLDCEYLTDAQVALVEKMRKDGKRLVFFHAPGYVSQTGLHPNRFPETASFMKERLLTAAELRTIYREAGVHVYTDDDVVLSANANWVMVHAASPRTCRVRLPRTTKRVYDIVTERELATNADEVDVVLGDVQTAVLLCEFDCTVAEAPTETAREPSPIVPFVIPSGKPDAAEIRGIVGSLAEAGCDQFLVYPSTGLDYDYLGEEFFAMVGTFLDEAKARNMKVWLYDEFNWPSGTARGRVPAGNEKCLYRELVAVTNVAGKVAWEIVVSRETNVDNYCLDTNNLEPESVRRFMELTHLEYERRFGQEMGSLIRGIFSDEPGHCSSAWRLKMPEGTVLRLPWWSGMEEEYRLASGGRDFRADLEAAIRGGALGGCETLRLWTDLRSRRYRRTYFDRIAAWCRKVGIVSTGHLVAENDTPMCARVNGSPLHTLKGFTKPGIDLIASNTDRDFEWITLAFGQSAALANGTCGMAELFALGPCDLTFAIMRKLYWICALHGIDTYFQVTYHHKACRFDVKDGWAMFTSPTQPWFREMPLLHATAKEAARWAAKPFVCEIAVVYPQCALGAAGVSGAVSRPPIEELCRELSWNQFTYRLVEEDEKTDCPVVLDWEGTALVVRGTKTRFDDVAASVRWLETRFAARPRVTDAAGRTCPGFITRAYLDGSAVAVDATSGEVIIALDGKFVREGALTGASLVADGAKVPLALSGRSCRRVWFRGGDNKAEIRLTMPLKAIRFAVCRYPADRRLSVTLDGKPLDFAKPCASVAFAFDDLYRETEPVDLGAGEHVFALSGGNDGKLFLPAMWMIGDFVERERNILSPFTGEVRLGSLASVGLGSFAGTSTYRLEAKFASDERLSVDSGGAVARVRFGGRDLGAKGWVPFVWDIPEDLAGRKLPLEIDVITSIRPIFGSETDPEANLNHGLWVKPSLANPSAVGLRQLSVVRMGSDQK